MWALPVDWKPSVSVENGINLSKYFLKKMGGLLISGGNNQFEWKEWSKGERQFRWLKTAWKSAKCFQCWNWKLELK